MSRTLRFNKEMNNLFMQCKKRAADSIDMNKQFIFGRRLRTQVTLTIVDDLLSQPL